MKVFTGIGYISSRAARAGCAAYDGLRLAVPRPICPPDVHFTPASGDGCP